MYTSSQASLSFSLSAPWVSLSNSARSFLAPDRASHAELSSSWPIQMLKLWFIQEPGNSLGRVSLPGCLSRYPATVATSKSASWESLS